ncbi:MAG: hypothetical protein EBY11_14505 [Proteobacteria bacterium]|nr:hypothetical protein [Pseudomonadota bacterium]
MVSKTALTIWLAMNRFQISEYSRYWSEVMWGCMTYPTCDFAIWQRPVPEPCPVDGQMQTLQAGGKVVCTVCGHVTQRVKSEEDLPVDGDDDEEGSDALDVPEAPALIAAGA